MKTTMLLVGLLAGAAACPGQSLWDAGHPRPPLAADTIARFPGDLLTIVISESQTIRNKEIAEFEKELDLDAALLNFDVLPQAFNPLPSVQGFSDRTLEGDAKYDKEGTFETRISVVVIDIQPNGNLIVEGRRRVVMDRETKLIRITGVVRPFDVAPDNTVRSERVANAAIAYEGDGPLTTATNRGWLSELLDYVWPF